MGSERGFRRLVAFSDAVVAIAITLLVLPLVDSASSIGSADVGHYLDQNRYRLFAFGLSFVVIGNFWWGQHQSLERIRSYNAALVWTMFVWLAGIVFLPFPTELLGSSGSGHTSHVIYVGTLLVTAIGAFGQEWVLIHWPELQEEKHRGSATTDTSLILAAVMALCLVAVIMFPAVGLWSLLLLLLLVRPFDGMARRWRVRRAERAR